MTTRPPAEVGMPVAEIDTPALVVDLDAYEHNLDLMAASLRGTPVRLRGHAKTHKCPEIARRQIARRIVPRHEALTGVVHEPRAFAPQRF